MFIRDKDVYGKLLYDPSVEKFFSESTLFSYLVCGDHGKDKYTPSWHPWKINSYFLVDYDQATKKTKYSLNPNRPCRDDDLTPMSDLKASQLILSVAFDIDSDTHVNKDKDIDEAFKILISAYNDLRDKVNGAEAHMRVYTYAKLVKTNFSPVLQYLADHFSLDFKKHTVGWDNPIPVL